VNSCLFIFIQFPFVFFPLVWLFNCSVEQSSAPQVRFSSVSSPCAIGQGEFSTSGEGRRLGRTDASLLFILSCLSTPPQLVAIRLPALRGFSFDYIPLDRCGAVIEDMSDLFRHSPFFIAPSYSYVSSLHAEFSFLPLFQPTGSFLPRSIQDLPPPPPQTPTPPPTPQFSAVLV